MEEIAAAVRDGAQLRGSRSARSRSRRNLPEARAGRRARARDRRAHRVLREPDPHEDAPAGACAARAVADAMGPLTLVALGEEHARSAQRVVLGPDAAGRRRAVRHGLPLASRSVGTCSRRPGGRPRFLEPQTVSCDVGLLKWGQPRWRAELLERHGVDYGRDAGRGLRDRHRHVPQPRDRTSASKAQFTVSWMYDKQGLRLLVDGLGPGLRARGEQPALTAGGLHRRRGGGVGRRRGARAREGDGVAGPARDPAERARSVRLHRRERRCARRVPRRTTGVARLRRTGSRSCASRWPRTCRPKRGASSTSPTPTRGSARRLRAADPTGPRCRGAPGQDPSRLNGPLPIWSRMLITGGFVIDRRCQFAPSTTRVCPEMKRA